MTKTEQAFDKAALTHFDKDVDTAYAFRCGAMFMLFELIPYLNREGCAPGGPAERLNADVAEFSRGIMPQSQSVAP